MLVLITYDVNTEDAAGRKRLRQIAKQCVNYGQRVQCSVFECLLDAAQCRSLQAKLCSIMDMEKDSLRFYYLGNRYQSKIDHFGCKSAYMLKTRSCFDAKSKCTDFFDRFAPKKALFIRLPMWYSIISV